MDYNVHGEAQLGSYTPGVACLTGQRRLVRNRTVNSGAQMDKGQACAFSYVENLQRKHPEVFEKTFLMAG
jgi:hypothetical protein